MEYNKRIADMVAGDSVEGFYILKGVYPKTSANGKPFLSATLADRDGEIEAKVWDYSGPIGSADGGKIVKVRGSVSEYRGALQMIVERIRLRETNDAVDLAALVPVAPIDLDRAYAEIEALVASMQDPDYAAVCKTMLERHGKAFREIPAAKSVHHGFIGGLLMHTGNMLKLADFLARQYVDTVNRDLLLAGTLLHDFSKAREFSFSELGLVTAYSVSGQLLGHLVMGAQEVAEVAKEVEIPEEKSVLLQHMILSHHGQPEFGAAVVPICAESELLYLIDTIDSKMEIYRETLAGLQPGEVSNRIFSLEKRVYRHH